MKPKKEKNDTKKKIEEGINHWVMLSDIKTGCNWNMFKEGLVEDIFFLLKSQREELKKKVEGMKYRAPGWEAYNQALSDILTLLEE